MTGKSNFHNIFCDAILWTQHNILETHKLNHSGLNDVNNVILTNDTFWMILKYNMVFSWFERIKTFVGGILRSICMWPWPCFLGNSYFLVFLSLGTLVKLILMKNSVSRVPEWQFNRRTKSMDFMLPTHKYLLKFNNKNAIATSMDAILMPFCWLWEIICPQNMHGLKIFNRFVYFS